MGNSGMRRDVFKTSPLKKLLIGIHAKPRSGKDTIADHIVRRYGFLKYGPSFPMKEATAAMFNLPLKIFWDEKLKEEVVPYWNLSPRQMMQLVGKESSRDIFGEDFWMRHVEVKWETIQGPEYSAYYGMVLADIRYGNEVEWIKQRGGIVIYLDRPDRVEHSTDSHPAEHGLPREICTDYICNDGTIRDLQDKVDYLIISLGVV